MTWLREPAIQTAEACVFRCDHGASTACTLDEAREQVRHPVEGVKRDDLLTVIAYLSCQVIGLRHARNADAELALLQIKGICSTHDERIRREIANKGAEHERQGVCRE